MKRIIVSLAIFGNLSLHGQQELANRVTRPDNGVHITQIRLHNDETEHAVSKDMSEVITLPSITLELGPVRKTAPRTPPQEPTVATIASTTPVPLPAKEQVMDDLESLDKAVGAQNDYVQTLQKTTSRLREARLEAQSKLKTALEDKQRLEAEHIAVQANVTRLQTDLLERDAELQNFKQNSVKLKDFEAVKAEVAAKTTELQGLHAASTQQQQQLQAAQASLAEQAAATIGLRAELAQVQAATQTAQATQMAEFKASTSQQQQALASLNKDYSALQLAQTGLQQELVKRDAQLSACTQEQNLQAQKTLDIIRQMRKRLEEQVLGQDGK